MSLPALQAAHERPRILTHAVIQAANLLGLNHSQLGRVLGLSQPSVTRMYNGQRELVEGGTDWQLATLLLRLYRSLDALVGGDDGKASQWLRSENEHLQATPLQLIQSIEGLVGVVRYLDGMLGRM